MTRSSLLSRPGRVRFVALLRLLGCISTLGALAACAARQEAVIDQSGEAERYQARARGNYVAPGPADDPWGPYISEASHRYDVPERWVREVMRVESGGKMYQNGSLITSRVGAMGLMQVMPETYDELRARYDLSDDAYDPHNNVLAGAAYLREMYDIYGSPGFLAAYNAGPKRLDDYLANVRPLPDETRRYVAMIGPYIQDADPATRSAAEQYAMNTLPINIPPGLRYGGHSFQVAEARPARGWRSSHAFAAHQYPARQYASTSRAPVRMAFAEAPPPPTGRHHQGFSLIQPAMAETLPTHRSGGWNGGWAVQVGAFGNQSQAHAAAGAARGHAPEALGHAQTTVASVRQGNETLYRARVGGLSRSAATQACHKLSHGKSGCMVLSPASQS